MLLIALRLLQTYWKPLILVLAVAGIYLLGRVHGADGVRAEWTADTMRQMEAASKEHARMQAAADRADAEASRTISRLRNEMSTIATRLAYATHDPAYRCRPTAGGLRALNDGIAAASRAATGRDD